MFRGLIPIVYKEAIHILRDPKTLVLMLVVPGVQLTIFGYAIDLDVEHIPTAVYNLDGREPSRALIDAFTNSGYFDIRKTALSDDELNGAIVRGTVKSGIKIPPDYTDRLRRNETAQVQLLIDGSDSTVAMQALNVGNAIALDRSIRIAAANARVAPRPAIDLRPRILFNPSMETARFMVPGLVGIILQLVTMFLTAFAVVREKEAGTFEQLMATPVSRLGLLCGKIGPYAAIGAIETVLVLVLMRYLFGVPIQGSLALLAALSLLFLFTALGLGVFISTIATSQVQAMQIAFLVMLPSVLLSGFVFPQESMPLPIYALGQAIPVTYYIRILRGIILRGADFSDLWVDAAKLAAFGAILLAVSLLRFRKTVA